MLIASVAFTLFLAGPVNVPRISIEPEFPTIARDQRRPTAEQRRQPQVRRPGAVETNWDCIDYHACHWAQENQCVYNGDPLQGCYQYYTACDLCHPCPPWVEWC